MATLKLATLKMATLKMATMKMATMITKRQLLPVLVCRMSTTSTCHANTNLSSDSRIHDASKPTLTYFNVRGRAETIRICLAAAGVEFNEILIESREQFLMEKQGWMFGQCPCLDINDHRIVQSNTILRYLGRIYHMNGTNAVEEILVDQYFEGTRDFRTPFILIGFQNEQQKLAEVEGRTIPTYMPVYEQILSSSGGCYLVGANLSIADIGLLEVLMYIDDYLGMKPFETYPYVKKYYNGLMNKEWTQHFMKTYRKSHNTPEYMKKVYEILGTGYIL